LDSLLYAILMSQTARKMEGENSEAADSKLMNPLTFLRKAPRCLQYLYNVARNSLRQKGKKFPAGANPYA